MASIDGAKSLPVGAHDTYECDPCRFDGCQIKACHYCEQCNEYLCSSCRDHHGKLKVLRAHKISKISSEDGSRSVQCASDEIYMYECDPCKSDGSVKWAWHYCAKCQKYMCHACRDYHRIDNDLQDHKILSGPLLPKRPVSKQATTFGVQQVHDISKLTVKSSSKVNVKLSGPDEIPRITGCTFMPGGQLLLCDFWNNNIKLLDNFLAIQESLAIPCKPWNVAIVDDSTVVVTFPFKQKLQYVEITPKLSQRTTCTISFDVKCWGVAVTGNEIYVSCHDNTWSTTGDVRVLDCRGNELRRICVNKDGSRMFNLPFFVAADSNGNRIYVSDWLTNTITRLNTNGDDVYRYKDDDLVGSHALYVDTKGNIIVCVGDKISLQVITAAGTKHLLIHRDGINIPIAITFRPRDGTLVVSCYDQEELFVFKLA